MTTGLALSEAPYLTAAETLSLIAYGHLLRFAEGQLAPGEPPMMERWGFCTTASDIRPARRERHVYALRWVVARVRWRLTRDRRRGRWRTCPLQPLHPHVRHGDGLRANMRLWLRRMKNSNDLRGAAGLVPDLCADLEACGLAKLREEAALREASARLTRAAMAGQLHILGRRGKWGNRSFRSLDHEAVPAEFFVSGRRIVCPNGWAMLDAFALDSDGHEWGLWRDAAAPDWGELRIPRAEAMALWGPKPAPALSRLPAAWTMIECLVWIALRDTQAVREAGEETARPAEAFEIEARLPDGRSEMVKQVGERGYNLDRLHSDWAWRRSEGAPFLGPPPHEAKADLLEKLRSGDLVALGIPTGGSEAREMSPADWRQLDLLQRGRTLEPESSVYARRWRAVTIARESMAQHWRPFGTPAGPDLLRAEPGTMELPLWMTELEALVWIVTRDADLVAHLRRPEDAPQPKLESLQRRELWPASAWGGINTSWLAMWAGDAAVVIKAEADLRDAVVCGSVSTEQQPVTADLRRRANDDAILVTRGATLLMVQRDGIVRLWPEQAASMLEDVKAGLPVQASTANAAVAEAHAWMLAEAQRIGSKPKRDMLVKDCVLALGCRYEDAEAAQAKLPPEYRRTRGEKDRAAVRR